MALFQYCVMHGGAYFDSSFVFSVRAKRIKQKKPRMFKACLLIVRGGGGSGRPLPKFVLLWVVAARGVAGAWLRGRGGSPLRRVEVVVGAAGASDLGVARSVAGVVGVGLFGCRCVRAVGSSARSGRSHPALISGLLSCGFLTVPAWLPGPWPRVKLVEEIQIGGNPLVGPGRPRQRRCSRAPLFFLETSVYVCSFISSLSTSQVKTLTPVGGGGVLDVVTFLKPSH